MSAEGRLWALAHGIEATWPVHLRRLRDVAKATVASADIRLLAADRGIPFGTCRRLLYGDERPGYLQQIGRLLGWTEEQLLQDIQEHAND